MDISSCPTPLVVISSRELDAYLNLPDPVSSDSHLSDDKPSLYCSAPSHFGSLPKQSFCPAGNLMSECPSSALEDSSYSLPQHSSPSDLLLDSSSVSLPPQHTSPCNLLLDSSSVSLPPDNTSSSALDSSTGSLPPDNISSSGSSLGYHSAAGGSEGVGDDSVGEARDGVVEEGEGEDIQGVAEVERVHDNLVLTTGSNNLTPRRRLSLNSTSTPTSAVRCLALRTPGRTPANKTLFSADRSGAGLQAGGRQGGSVEEAMDTSVDDSPFFQYRPSVPTGKNVATGKASRSISVTTRRLTKPIFFGGFDTSPHRQISVKEQQDLISPPSPLSSPTSMLSHRRLTSQRTRTISAESSSSIGYHGYESFSPIGPSSRFNHSPHSSHSPSPHLSPCTALSHQGCQLSPTEFVERITAAQRCRSQDQAGTTLYDRATAAQEYKSPDRVGTTLYDRTNLPSSSILESSDVVTSPALTLHFDRNSAALRSSADFPRSSLGTHLLPSPASPPISLHASLNLSSPFSFHSLRTSTPGRPRSSSPLSLSPPYPSPATLHPPTLIKKGTLSPTHTHYTQQFTSKRQGGADSPTPNDHTPQKRRGGVISLTPQSFTPDVKPPTFGIDYELDSARRSLVFLLDTPPCPTSIPLARLSNPVPPSLAAPTTIDNASLRLVRLTRCTSLLVDDNSVTAPSHNSLSLTDRYLTSPPSSMSPPSRQEQTPPPRCSSSSTQHDTIGQFSEATPPRSLHSDTIQFSETIPPRSLHCDTIRQFSEAMPPHSCSVQPSHTIGQSSPTTVSVPPADWLDEACQSHITPPPVMSHIRQTTDIHITPGCGRRDVDKLSAGRQRRRRHEKTTADLVGFSDSPAMGHCQGRSPAAAPGLVASLRSAEEGQGSKEFDTMSSRYAVTSVRSRRYARNQPQEPLRVVVRDREPLGVVGKGKEPHGVVGKGWEPLGKVGRNQEPPRVVRKDQEPLGVVQRDQEAVGVMVTVVLRTQVDVCDELIGDLTRTYCLPLVSGARNNDLKNISIDTVADVMRGVYSSVVRSFTFVDCRYPYEYNGGHLIGAKNIYTQEDIVHEFFSASSSLPCAVSCVEKSAVELHMENMDCAGDGDVRRDILIFHCEFSSERAPKLLRFLREHDRRLHSSSYPSLSYPELYLIDGGYRALYHLHPSLCHPSHPGYVPMMHREHAEELRRFRAQARNQASSSADPGKSGVRKYQSSYKK